MSNKENISRSTYLSKNVGNFPENISLMDIEFTKVDDLRYGTNPHQTAAFYKLSGTVNPIGDMQILKTGKSGLSQTNLEDISYSLNIVKYFTSQACACMKHVNPSGFASAKKNETLKEVYIRARDCDPRAAFGSVVTFNTAIDKETAEEIMSTFVECVVAPEISDDVLAVFNDQETHKLNRHIRIIKCGDISQLPKFTGDDISKHRTIKVLHDGSLVIADPILTSLKSSNDLQIAFGENKRCGKVKSEPATSQREKDDLLAAWYINMNVRSNGVVLMKNSETISVGTGEQDRVGAVEQAIWKYQNKYEGNENIKGSVMSSDGFFPFADAIEIAAKEGVLAIIAPAGSLRDADVIKRANELGVALFHAPERIFSHH